MKRREFFTTLKTDKLNTSPRVSDGLEPYTNPLTKTEVYHLLRRLHFAPTYDLVKSLIGKTASEAVEMLIGDASYPLPEKPNQDWDTTMEENPLTVGNNQLRFEIEGRIRSRYRQFIDWWIDLMRSSEFIAREKMTLFWSTVWTMEFTYDTLALIPTPLLYRNNQTLREYAFGNHRQFAEAITLNGAMLLYQSLQYGSVKNGQKANENYMRELMELFTMGTGNYTEADIREGSRALTGWRTACYVGEPHSVDTPFETYFDQTPGVHDLGAKEFMGDTIPARSQEDNTEYQVRKDEVGGILNIMYNRRAEAISLFICEKIYRYFVYSNKFSDDSKIISEMAELFRNNNFEILPVIKTLFTSKHFFNQANIGIQLKPPPEFIIGLQTQLGVEYSSSREAIADLDQVLYDPPNVGSWEAYRTWISTSTFPLRVKYANEILDLADDNNLLNLAKQFENFSNAENLITSLSEYFLPRAFDDNRKDYYKSILLDSAGTDEQNWGNVADNKAASAIRNVIKEFIKAPDFQLS